MDFVRVNKNINYINPIFFHYYLYNVFENLYLDLTLNTRNYYYLEWHSSIKMKKFLFYIILSL